MQLSISNYFDVAIIGGGLSGLSLSIQLAKTGYQVILFEKETFPFHRVCGEYISMESWDFLTSLGVDLEQMQVPKIHKLNVTSPAGLILSHDLDNGGFGISRYVLDNELCKIAKAAGVIVRENSKVEDVIFDEEIFAVYSNKHKVNAKVVVSAFGKRSNLDVKWRRKFINIKAGKLNNYIGVKYHVEIEHPSDTISLHNFQEGYCGISKVENNKYCLCYLTTAANLKRHNNSIREMEIAVLHKNPFLKSIFNSAKFLLPSPVTIAQISFDKKSAVEEHILMIGDAAGMITPLCGNGMSMAFQSGKLAYQNIISFIDNRSTRKQMEIQYTRDWQRVFSKRLRAGRIIQMLFGKQTVTNMTIRLLKQLPSVVEKLIRSTHGDSF